MTARLETNGNAAMRQLSMARQELIDSTAQFNADSERLLGHSVPTLTTSVNSYLKNGLKVIDLADMRRNALENYWMHFEALNTRVKALVDGAWKIFGRVIARQSLIEMSKNLDEVRLQAAVIKNREDYDAAEIERLRTSEALFLATLEKNAQSFSHADSKDWLPSMRDDYSLMLQQQETLIQLDTQRSEREERYAQDRVQLADAIAKNLAGIPTQLTEHQAVSTMMTKAESAQLVPALSETSPIEKSQDDKTDAALVDMSPASTTMVIKGSDKHVLLAWLSGALLVLLVGVLTLIARSIIKPVRSLLRATEQVARGQLSIVVPSGGIKELNALTGAFNQMAEQLAAAQASNALYQQSLELKVEQRTRELQRLAEHDPLTQLPNRRQLFTRLSTAIQNADHGSGRVAVFFIDVDNFKYINDTLGHAFGDRVLLAISRRLEQAAQLFGFAARLGGDEFTIICEEKAGETAIDQAKKQLAEAFNQSLNVDEHDLSISVSIGLVTYPECNGDAEALLRAADAALFRAKALGRSQINVFTADLLKMAEDKFTIEQGLRRAIERNEFELVYQPELCVETFEVRLVEALIRWRLPDGRLVAPGDFLAVAEESGLIMDISDWVMRSAIETAANWYHGEWPSVRVAINVSPRQLMGVHFVETVQDLLKQFRLPPECIEIELTETVLQTGAATIATLLRLKECGIAIALDDFGSGYSSLASLEQLPLSRIKLDRSLIQSIDTNVQSKAIAHAIIGLAHGLGLAITAEGVERSEQFSLLLEYAPLYLQGYLLSRPVSQHELTASLPRVSERAHELLLSVPQLSALTEKVVALNPASRRSARIKK